MELRNSVSRLSVYMIATPLKTRTSSSTGTMLFLAYFSCHCDIPGLIFVKRLVAESYFHYQLQEFSYPPVLYVSCNLRARHSLPCL